MRKVSEADLLKESQVVSQNKKRISDEADLSSRSMLKKNEISLVFLGAAIVSVLLFFFFFGASDQEKPGLDSENLSKTVQALEERLIRLEEAVQTFDVAGSQLSNDDDKGSAIDIEQYRARVERVETALSVKFDVMTARVDNIEEKLKTMAKGISNITAKTDAASQITTANTSTTHQVHSNATKTANAGNGLSSSAVSAPDIKKAAKSISTVSESQATSSKITSSTSTEKQSQVASSASTAAPQIKPSAEPVYHTVAKGDTLYNISKKYNTTVPHLRKINGMTTKDAIIIGQKLLIKE